MQSIDDFVEQANDVETSEGLAELLVRAMRAEGYDNVTFRSVKAGSLVHIPCAALPPTFIDQYYANHFMPDDPFVATGMASRKMFFWNDLEKSDKLTPRQLEVFHAFRELGVHSGMTFPFHGPDGACDLIGLSQRHFLGIDHARVPIIEKKLAYVRWRYWEIRQKSRPADYDRQCDSTFLAHGRGPRGMKHAHCRALVFVAVAAQRWQRGLMRFNRQIFDYVDELDVEFLLRWGLVHDVPDDKQFFYYLSPTVLGANHLATCTHVPELRRQVWEMETCRRDGFIGDLA